MLPHFALALGLKTARGIAAVRFVKLQQKSGTVFTRGLLTLLLLVTQAGKQLGLPQFEQTGRAVKRFVPL